MQKEHSFFDDMAKMASSATGTLFDMKREVESAVASQMEKLLLKMNFVRREEFEAVKQMAATAREEAEQMKARIEALESTSAPKKSTKKASS